MYIWLHAYMYGYMYTINHTLCYNYIIIYYIIILFFFFFVICVYVLSLSICVCSLLVGCLRDEEAKVLKMSKVYFLGRLLLWILVGFEKVWTTSLNFWCLNPAVVRAHCLHMYVNAHMYIHTCTSHKFKINVLGRLAVVAFYNS